MADTENSLIETSGIPEIEQEVEVFGMTQAEVDKTLTIEDCAADAKTVGDRLANVVADISDLAQELTAMGTSTGESISELAETVAENLQAAQTELGNRISPLERQTGADIRVSAQSEQSIAEAIAAVPQEVVNRLYPVGSIFMSTSATAPALTGTTWTEILITATWGQLKTGERSHQEGASTGTVHFWLRTA